MSYKKNKLVKQVLFLIGLLLQFANQSAFCQEVLATKKIRINPDAAYGGTVSQYVEELKFITFEATSKSAFGNIDQLEVTDLYYIILDSDTQSILFFYKVGKFHAKIDAKAFNPQQPYFYSFAADQQQKTIKINFLSGEYVFDYDGKLVEHHKKSPSQYLGVETYLGKNTSAYYLYAPQRPLAANAKSAFEITVLQNGKLSKQYLPYKFDVGYKDQQNSQSHLDFWKIPNTADSVVSFTRDYDYNIYQLSPHTFQARYRFVLPNSYSIPENFRSDSVYNNKRQQFLNANKQQISKIGNYYEAQGSLFFRLISKSFDMKSYAYNTVSNKLISINNIVSDQSSYFLPITDAEIGGADFVNRGIIHYDGDFFYTSYSSLILFRRMENSKDKNIRYSPVLEQYFKDKKNAKGNPVLIQLKFKPNL